MHTFAFGILSSSVNESHWSRGRHNEECRCCQLRGRMFGQWEAYMKMNWTDEWDLCADSSSLMEEELLECNDHDSTIMSKRKKKWMTQEEKEKRRPHQDATIRDCNGHTKLILGVRLFWHVVINIYFLFIYRVRSTTVMNTVPGGSFNWQRMMSTIDFLHTR